MQLTTTFEPAFDRRNMGMGFNGVVMRMIVKGDLGVVHFVLFTNWNLDHIDRMITNKELQKPKPVEVGYYSLYRELYKGQPKMYFCPYLNHAECYYDGLEHEGQEAFALLREYGSGAVWEYLISKYNLRFRQGAEEHG